LLSWSQQKECVSFCIVLEFLLIIAVAFSEIMGPGGRSETKKNNLAPVINSIDDDAVRMNDVTGTCWRPERQYVE